MEEFLTRREQSLEILADFAEKLTTLGYKWKSDSECRSLIVTGCIKVNAYPMGCYFHSIDQLDEPSFGPYATLDSLLTAFLENWDALTKP